jgi:hypothetical protein
VRAIFQIVVAVLSLASAVSGCSSGSQAMIDTARGIWSGTSAVDSAPLNPRLRYLRVSIDGRVALLVLGYVDPHPQGRIEVWYSAQHEVLKLQNGRIVGATGLTTEWRHVALPALPDWGTLLASTQPLDWVRTRDVMPGYRYGIRDALRLERIAAPDATRLLGEDSKNLVWFEETLTPDQGDAPALPPARYALDLHAAGEPVVYGEACLARDLCFAWQRWPAAAQEAVGAR